MSMQWIDLRSDTVTLPSNKMIEAIVAAHQEHRLGDDVYGEDQVVNELEETAAAIFGKEEALLVTSGTQGNLVSLLSQAKPGDEVLLEAQSHIFLFESAGMSAVGGLFPRTLTGEQGFLPPVVIEDAIREPNIHHPRSRMLAIENTHNLHGGTCLTIRQTELMAKAAHDNGLLVHLDGARIFNAAVAQKVDVKRLVDPVDSVQVCLSKGLAAPVGSLVLGTHEFINEARRARKRLGGGMRQAGIIAAPGLIALTEMPSRLHEDHDNASRLAHGINDIPGLCVQQPETNIINIWLNEEAKMDAFGLRDFLMKHQIKIMCRNRRRIRAVTHYGITQLDIDKVTTVFQNAPL
ncbi:MAG: GntG family PLP-dependent aldolase [Candidatus Ranarchaeia archaeon]